MDSKGFVMSGMSFLLILPAVMLFVVFLDLAHSGADSDSLALESDTVLQTSKDLETNIPLAGKEALKSTAEDVIKKGEPLSNSRISVRDNLQGRMNQLCADNYKNTGLDVECDIKSVESSADPFQVEINSTIRIRKDRVVHQQNLTQYASLIDPQFPMPNPLPFTKCRDYGGAQEVGNRIYFASSLSVYLKARGVENATAYENATTSLIIKKCPYDPYIMHGGNDFVSLKNCIENGYFHESADGSCFLCRLEGKGTCPHYGMETFIVPAVSTNSSLKFAPSSIDHVIFNDTSPGTGTYPGKALIYDSEDSNFFKIFLDNSHRNKYGLPLFRLN